MVIPTPPTLEIRNLSLIYPDGVSDPKPALAGISLAVRPGEICGVIGAPGAGKSSLLRAAAGRVTAQSGEVLICGEHLTGGQPGQVCAWLQGDLQPDPSAELLSTASGERAGLVRGLARVLGVEEFSHRPFCALPQTFQDRARLLPLLSDPAPLLVLDEHPGLSAETAARLADWLPDHMHSQQQALLLSTQKPGLIRSLCDRLFVLYQGKLVADEPVERSTGLLQQSIYRIRVRGRVDLSRLQGLEIHSIQQEGGDTVLRGVFMDQPALYGALARLRDLGLVLLTVEQLQESQGDRIARLMEHGAA